MANTSLDVENSAQQSAEASDGQSTSWHARIQSMLLSFMRLCISLIVNLPANTKRFFFFIVYYVYDTSSTAYYIWLAIVATAATYDLTIIIVRSVFTDLQRQYINLWFALDYSADGIYILDMLVKSRTGIQIDYCPIANDFIFYFIFLSIRIP